MTTASKIVSLDDLRPWRQAIAGRVVFTNGVFDLLHEGHVASLAAARQLGDALIVGLNSDASVRRLGKGPGRPVVPESGRARALAALAAVDRVVLFEEDTPRALIAAVRPDVLVKGADYVKSAIVGADLVESWGGEVHLTQLVPGISTTTILRSSHGSS